MTQPRSPLIAVEDTPDYHLTSRCVRRAFLCGNDSVTGKDYEHRRQWIENRIRLLSSIFALSVCSYAVMSNHFHIVMKLMPHEADSWSNTEVLERWTSLYKGPLLVQRWLAQDKLTSAEYDAVIVCINEYRERLGGASWFMKCLNEPLARQANQEDDCTGHYYKTHPCVLPFGPPIQAFKNIPDIFVKSPIHVSSPTHRKSFINLYGLCGFKPHTRQHG